MSGPAETAAYHGRGFRPRQATFRTEIAGGRTFRSIGTDSEWAPLRHVLISLPDVDWPLPDDWNDVQFLGPARLGRIASELQSYAETLTTLGISVSVVAPRPHGELPLYNICFTRDQLFCTPEGAVVGRMGSEARAGEELSITRALADLGMPILRTISGPATFEGADALWVRPDHLLLGVGNRTNEHAFRQITSLMSEQGVSVSAVRMPREVQHLLGLLQIVGPADAILRSGICDPQLGGLLRRLGFSVHEWPEHEEISKQAMNFVVVGERRVVMLAGRPWAARRLGDAGVDVAATVQAEELLKAAGGLACATGVLRRDLVGGTAG